MARVTAPLRVALIRDRDDLGAAIADSLRRLGCDATVWSRHDLPPGLRFRRPETDLVLAYGPHNGSILDAAAAVHFQDRDRPVFVWWLLENLPSMRWPHWALAPAASLRLALDRLLRRWSGRAIAAVPSRSLRVLELGQRVRIYGEALWLHRRGALDGLFVDSAVAARLLQSRGVPAIHLPLGGHQSFGRDLGLSRDIDVVFLGQPGSRRRRRLLERTQAELVRRGIQLLVLDGRTGYLDGDARTELLNRCKVVLNILKAPEDSAGLRFLLAAANKAVTVSEPSPALTLLKPREHFVEAPATGLAEAVDRCLRDDQARADIASRAYALLTGPGHVDHMTSQIIEHARRRVLDL